MSKTAILSLVYYEPQWHKTCVCISRMMDAYPVYFVDRDGIGSLAHAFNAGFELRKLHEFDYVWFLTDVEFQPDVLPKLILALTMHPQYAAITPAFASDHVHTQPLGVNVVREAPFVEFTAPLVRAKVFSQIKLDEEMPYDGHDVDWGARVRDYGMKLGVHHGVKIEHAYLRKFALSHHVTMERSRLRAAAQRSTKETLHRKWGEDWKQKLQCNY